MGLQGSPQAGSHWATSWAEGRAAAQTCGGKRGGSGRAVAMETLLWQVETLPGLLAVSRSGQVRDWDPPTVDRALQWGRYFQQLHGRFRAQPRLRAALGQRLRRRRQGPPLGFGHLGRCPELLGLALLGNRALPPAACHRLLRSLLLPPRGQATPGPCSLGLLARRRAAVQLLLLPPSSAPTRPGEPEPPLRTEAQLLLSRLQEDEEEQGLAGVLGQLPGPRVYRVLAALLLEQAGDDAGREGARPAAAVLSWLIGDLGRFSDFCRLLPGSLLVALSARYPQLGTPYLHLLISWGSRLRYDPLRGQWASSRCPSEDELSWEELRERFSCFMRGPAPLREAALASLKNLKTQDGDFEVCGLSVWTDLLLEMEAPLEREDRTLER
ncbi:Fanconi anemia group F protein [Dermochelys coriacea]|uniref:Fanconi anemia group F protein n=1 Tax=Dermochelys coriacea TaxID=27794 RepID=UPI001CA88EEB|nr:Fanconi anemia group F protein [Dermochelys coriacea]